MATPDHGSAQPPSPTEADPRWQQVVARDGTADGAFVYAVRSTGVYCRPSCPSRRARPENVRFFATAAEARAAGYRPCLRCRPDGPPPQTDLARAIAEACRRIEAAEDPLTLEELAAPSGVSRFHFHRRFKAVTGLTPKAYAAAHRAHRLRTGLADPDGSVTDAIYAAGFGSGSRFYEQADALLGMTPTAFRDGGRDTDIRFALGQCTLGAVLVAASNRGICAIALGDDPQDLVRDFQDRFPAANLIGADPAFEALIARVVGFVDSPTKGADLPLDIRGTAFQQRVWQALRAIPPGETVSYAELASRLGAPTAARAVARACAANQLAVAIPCHRVVRMDGTLSGYRWGVARKKALLDHEARAVSKPGVSPDQ